MVSLSRTEERNLLLMYVFADKAQKNINELQSRSIFSLENDLIAFISKYADINNISESEAKKRLTEEALKEYHQKLDYYIEEAESQEFAPQYIRELKKERKKSNIVMMGALMIIAGFELEKIRKEKEKQVEKAATEIYSYNKAYTKYVITHPDPNLVTIALPKHPELEKKTSNSTITLLTDKPDPRKIKAIINKPWADGSMFSDRIWKDKQKMLLELERELKTSFETGEDLKKSIKRFSETLEIDKSNARRLIQTEASRIAATAEIDAYKEYGLEKYVFLATLSEKTCPVCGALDGQVFDLKQAEAGVNVHPMHPYCRCTTKAYVPDIPKSKTRTAINPETGKTEIVENQTVNEWKQKNLFNEHKKIEIEAEKKLKQMKKIEDETYPKGPSKSYLQFKERLINFKNFEELSKSEDNNIIFKQDIKEVRKILYGKQVKNVFKPHAIDLYFRMRDNDLYISDHALERYFEREFSTKTNKRNYSYKEIMDLSKKKPNYIGSKDEREIIYENGISIIKDPNDHNKIITILNRKKPNERWRSV